MLKFKLLALIMGVAGISYGWSERTLAGRAQPKPTTLSCKDLATNGVGKNAHVVLTDFVLGRQYVFEEKKGTWQQVWMPAFPVESGYTGEGPPPRPIQVIVTSKRISTKEALPSFFERAQLQGVIVNSIDDLGPARQLLAKSYGNDVSTAYILEVARKVPNAAKGWLIVLISAAITVLGFVSLFFTFDEGLPRGFLVVAGVFGVAVAGAGAWFAATNEPTQAVTVSTDAREARPPPKPAVDVIDEPKQIDPVLRDGVIATCLSDGGDQKTCACAAEAFLNDASRSMLAELKGSGWNVETTAALARARRGCAG